MTYEYDGPSRRIRLGAPGGWPYYMCDAAGRMTRIESMGGAHAGSAYGTPGGFAATYYEYDHTGNVTTKTLVNGCYTYFAYDDADQISKLLNCLPDGSPLAYFEYEYDAASRITSVTREDGNVVYCGYDDADRLTTHVHILQANGESYRLRESKRRRQQDEANS